MILPVLSFPAPVLRKPTQTITVVDASIQSQLDDMIETMYAENGVGLAANQVGIPLKMTVIDVSEERNQAMCLINPEIIASEGLVQSEEGCLSFPGIYVKVPRKAKVRVRFLDRIGKIQEIEAENNLLSICLQHEIDHLNGITFFDHLSPLKQSFVLKKLKKQGKLS